MSKEAYSIFDFNTNFKIIYPIEIKPYLISNPDTPLNVCTKITYNNETVEVIPIIYSSINYEGGSFFDYMNLGLLVVKNIHKNGINYKISKRDVNNNPKIINVTDSKIPKNKKRLDMINNISISNNSTHKFQEINLVNNFKNKMGKNTNYNIHPEETSADHFTFLITQNDWKEILPQPEYVEKLLKVLQK